MVERIRWIVLLYLAPKVRVYIHLPFHAYTRSNVWTDFNPKLHDETISDIEEYLLSRFPGISYEVWRRADSGGRWHDLEEDNMILYTDLKLTMRDILWFHRMRETIWKERFDQEVIYIAIHPIWA